MWRLRLKCGTLRLKISPYTSPAKVSRYSHTGLFLPTYVINSAKVGGEAGTTNTGPENYTAQLSAVVPEIQLKG